MNIHEYTNEIICISDSQENVQRRMINLVSSLVFYDVLLLRYEYFCTCIPILKNYIMGCHGNHAISQNLFGLMFENNWFCFAVVPMNNLASIRNCHRVER